MIGDGAFRMGKTHTVCQDYVAAFASSTSAWALLADGCSSSPETDIGARLLVKSARAQIDYLRSALQNAAPEAWERYYAATLENARAVAQQLGLDARCLDATLLTAITAGDRWFLDMVGDGVVVVKGRDGALCVTSVSYMENCPDYLNYREDSARAAAFAERVGNVRAVRRWRMTPEGAVEAQEPVIETPAVWSGRMADTVWVALLSDGAHSFATLDCSSTSRTATPIPLPEVLKELLAFKSGVGQFVQRRLQRFLLRCAERGWQHHDDVALGVIAWEETE